MSTRYGYSVMRLLIYYPKARGDYYSVLVGRLLMLQSVSQGWGKVPLLAKLAMILSVALCIQTLSKENVDTRYMSLDPQHRTSIVAVGLDEQGERNFTFMVRPSADLFTT